MQTSTGPAYNNETNLATSNTGAAFARRMPGHIDRIARENANANDSEKQRLSNKVTRLAFITTACLLALSLTFYGAVKLFGDGISRGGHSASTAPLEVIIANSALLIPENVIRFPGQRSGGVHQRMELYLHWPSFSGYSDHLQTSFSRAGNQSDLIFLSLEPRLMSLEMSGRIDPIYSRFFDGPASTHASGLIRQPLSASGGFMDEDLYFEPASPYPYTVRCTKRSSGIGTPYCIRDVHIGKDLMLTYRFHIRHLSNWASIERRIRKFSNSLLMKR